MLRSIAEAALWRTSFKRRLPKDFGAAPLFVSPSCGLRYLNPWIAQVDPTLLHLVREHVSRDSMVWDIGANLGFFTFAAAAFAGPAGAVVAFEPDTTLVGLLRRSAAIQPEASARVTVVPVCCGGMVAPRTFQIAKRSRATNHLDGYGSTQTGGTRESQTVMCVSLDWALDHFPRPNVIKIDVEAAEIEVLEGAHRLLAEVRPVVICEVSPSASPRVSEILHAARYRFRDADIPSNSAPELAPWNTLAIPIECLDEPIGNNHEAHT